MTDYELTFIIPDVGEEVIGQLMEHFDCLPSTTHTGLHQLTMTCSGSDAVKAGKDAHFALMEFGVHAERIVPDLVTRSAIAQRIGVTPQAVGNWIRGDRNAGMPFPEAFSDVAGGVWLWTDVVNWARVALRRELEPGIELPTREDLDALNDCINRSYDKPEPAVGSYRAFRFPLVAATVEEHAQYARLIRLARAASEVPLGNRRFWHGLTSHTPTWWGGEEEDVSLAESSFELGSIVIHYDPQEEDRRVDR